MTNDELLHKWIAQTISAEELEVFKLRPEYDSLIELYSNTDNLQGPTLDQDSMLNTILSTAKVDKAPKLTDQNTNSKTLKMSTWVKLGVAACLLFIAGYFANFVLSPTAQLIEYNLAADQKIEGILPDNSAFTLYENSKLYYDQNEWPKNRILNLEGVAYFMVNKGTTFTVKTDLGNVQVLGTQFKVKAVDNLLQVNCNEGMVSVSSKNHKEFSEQLKEGEYCLIDSKGMTITKKLNLTKLRKVTVKQALNELSNRYKVNFETGGIDLQEELSCNFGHDDLKLALKTSLSTLGINHTISGNKVALRI